MTAYVRHALIWQLGRAGLRIRTQVCILNAGRVSPFFYSVKISNLPLILVKIGSGGV